VKRYEIILQLEAENELREAFAYIHAESPQNAASWLSGLYKAIDSLEIMPERCALAQENEDVGAEVRQFVYHSHRILFTVEGMKVCVHHIRHAAMQTHASARSIAKREAGKKKP